MTVELNAGEAAQLDQVRFQGCLLNAVNNACQAMIESESEQPTYNLSIKSSCIADEIVIEIVDSGPGISPENFEKIFEPMFSTRAFGVGLGMPIMRKLIEQHHGRMKVDSQLGEGTTVTLWLPIDKSEEN